MNNHPLACFGGSAGRQVTRMGKTLPVRPIHFELSCHPGEALNCIKQLHALATDCDFISLTEVVTLIGDHCSVLQKHDLFEGLKIRSRHTLMIGPQRAISVEAEKIIGFVGILPNGANFCIGLATYPEIVTLESGDILATGLAGRASWQGFVQTIRTSECGGSPHRCVCPMPQNCPQPCVRSHLIVIQILDQAERLGILREILDPAMYWELRDEQRLIKAIQRSKCAAVECA